MVSIDIENLTSQIKWNDFESFVSLILEQNNFKTKKNFRFKTKRKYEIDIVAIKNNLVLCIDCKQWKGGRYKKYSILKAINEHENRVFEFIKFLEDNEAAKSELKISNNSKFQPIIVTLLDEGLIKENNTFIIPMWKLNSFLLEIEKYL
jgi:Holliday junction resolvase-like predicted endonuclease